MEAVPVLHNVDFILRAPEARQVELIGDFNGWRPIPLERLPDGAWFLRLQVPPGHRQYLYLVDGKPRLDPMANGRLRHPEWSVVSLLAVS